MESTALQFPSLKNYTETLISSSSFPQVAEFGSEMESGKEEHTFQMIHQNDTVPNGDVAFTVDKFYTPLLFLLGTTGNLLSFTVFCMNSCRYPGHSSSSYYLAALAMSDTGFLMNLLLVWLESVHGGIITGVPSGTVLCPLVMYLGQVTCFISVYLTVAFSIERYIAIHYPLSRIRICTRSKSKRIIAGLAVLALGLFSYVWVIAKVIELPVVDYVNHNQTQSSYHKICSVPPEFFQVSEIANYVDSTVTLIIPIFIIVFINVRIGLKVWKIREERRTIFAIASSSTSSSPLAAPTNPIDFNRRMKAGQPCGKNEPGQLQSKSTHHYHFHHHPHPISAEFRVTKTLLLVSTSFVILNLPSHAIRCALFIQTFRGTSNWNAFLYGYQPWANILFNTSFGINFLLYLACGQNFRKSLRTILVRVCLRGNPKESLSRNKNNNTNGSLQDSLRLCENGGDYRGRCLSQAIFHIPQTPIVVDGMKETE